MKKIPTVFERDWNGDRSRVTSQVHAGCEWVLAGEGTATRKMDGSCCLVKDGRLYKRRELRKGDPIPADFTLADYDDETGKTIGWMPVGAGPEDSYHRIAFHVERKHWADGTYELVGPKVQGNPEDFAVNMLIAHADPNLPFSADQQPPRTFDELAAWFVGKNVEGIVWHHPDGRMAKIKARDFGLKRAKMAVAHKGSE